MGKKFSDQSVLSPSQRKPRRSREPLVFVVSSDRSHLDAVFSQCNGVPEQYAACQTIDELMVELARLPRFKLAFALVVEKSADAVDAPLLRTCKLEYPQLNYLIMLEQCPQAAYFRFQSMGVQNVILPPFDGVNLANEINTALPNIPQFKRHPGLTREGQIRLDFVIPSDLTYVLGVNYLVSLLLKEFSYRPTDSRINIPLACDEAITNAILHGNRSNPNKKVSLHFYISASYFKLVVRDQGEGFDFATIANPTRGRNLLRSSGRGIYLMHSVMDRIAYSEGGRVVELGKSNPGSKTKDGRGGC